jgi:hypothetical protein
VNSDEARWSLRPICDEPQFYDDGQRPQHFDLGTEHNGARARRRGCFPAGNAR